MGEIPTGAGGGLGGDPETRPGSGLRLRPASLVFAVLAPFVGFRGDWWWLPTGLLALGLGSYGLGLCLASISIRQPRIGNILLNLVFYTLVAIAGVNVPTEVFPEAVQRAATVLPMHHGILGTRSLLAEGASSHAFGQLGLG